ncbi:MAG: hypothetical protein HYV07_02440 [Deltaproteobacteria bacterium]|nr:hypothetical protein [Deltaproteobacteria bacterium]
MWGEKIKDDRLPHQTEARNESIFAHGRKPPKRETYDASVAVAKEVRRRLAEVESWKVVEPDPEMDFVELRPKAP